MRAKIFLRTILIIFTVCLGMTCTSAQETQVKEKDVPPAVIKAFKSAYPNATIRGYAREKEKGKLFFEIESTDGTTKRDVLYNPDGTVAEIEETINASDLPSAAQETIRSQYPKAVVTRAERTTVGDKVEYEVSVRQGKRRINLVFDSNGAVLKNNR
jgi:Putative beta-lactamase-inhibitor-like, PepSY-like